MASVPWGTLVYSRLERSEQRLCLWLVTQEGIRTDGQGGGGWWVGCGQLRPVAPSSQPDLEEGHVGSQGLTEVHAGCCRGRWLPAPGVGEHSAEGTPLQLSDCVNNKITPSSQHHFFS